jgi:hypothetical protein
MATRKELLQQIVQKFAEYDKLAAQFPSIPAGLSELNKKNLDGIRTKLAPILKPATPATPATPVAPAKAITGSVGEKGDNKPEDVVTVKTLLNKFGAGLDPANTNCGPKTIEAIKNFQKAKAGLANPDGLISPNGKTWKALTGGATAPAENPNSPTPPNVTPTPPANGKEQTIGGAETETEKKLQEFMQNTSGIPVQINPGKEPAQFVSVRPPYHINAAGASLNAVLAARKNNSKVASLIGKIGLGGGAGDGKATPEQMKKFLESCIAAGLVPQASLNAKGLRAFLDTYGVSVDCSGLAVQALNFLQDGDMSRDLSDQVGIMNTSMMKGEANKTKEGGDGKFKDILTPSAFKAGDLMLNYKEKGTSTYHVRIIIDVDVMEDGSVEFTTVESGGGDNLSAAGDGVGQQRWKFPNGSKIENLYAVTQKKVAGTSDQAYRYVRHKTLQ